jgi:hypothetical protein
MVERYAFSFLFGATKLSTRSIFLGHFLHVGAF